MQPNERNVTGSSITINFQIRQKTLSKSTKMFKISQPCLTSLMTAQNYSHKSESMASFSLHVISSARALPIVLKAEFNFELLLYITIYFWFSKVCKVQAADLNPRCAFKTYLIVLFLSPFLRIPFYSHAIHSF